IGLGSPGLGDQSTSPWTLGRVLIILGSLVGSILVLFGLIQLAWRLMSAGLTPVEQAYAGMTRLAALAGIGRLSSQTSQQFARALAASEPSIATEVGLIAWRFAISRYSHRDPSEEEYIHLKRSWKTVRGVLLRRALRRLNPIPNGRNGKAPARANT
ncbi:MAG: DUF4129 domain-containing protein, partial [SAR202 cluster bacterium]|nr:DUF4129 domain-containing protein [SAR202 cluster bacterium]